VARTERCNVANGGGGEHEARGMFRVGGAGVEGWDVYLQTGQHERYAVPDAYQFTRCQWRRGLRREGMVFTHGVVIRGMH